MKRYFLLVLMTVISFVGFSQGKLSDEDKATLQEQEEKLVKIGLVMIYSQEYEKRRDANYVFIKEFSKALKVPYSYEYDFPKLNFIQKVVPADNQFRVFTWQVKTQAELVRHFGTIQLNEKDLVLFPLVDRSDDMSRPANFVGDNRKWYGAMYYQIKELPTSKTHKKYLLFGQDSNNPVSTKKVIDVLQFNREKKPVFGAPIFPKWKKPNHTATRYLVEFKSSSSFSMKYDKEKGKILFDHLVAMKKSDEGIYMNYVPDGTFDALEWNGKQFVEKTNVVYTKNEPPTVDEPNEKEPTRKFFYKSKKKEKKKKTKKRRKKKKRK